MKNEQKVKIFISLFLALVLIIIVSVIWSILYYKAVERAFEQGRIAGREEGQQSVKGQLLPPEPGRTYKGVVAGQDVVNDDQRFYELKSNSVLFEKGELYFVENDEKIVHVQKVR